MLLQENGNGHVWGVPALWFPEGDQTRIAKAGNHPGFLQIGEIRSHPIRKEKRKQEEPGSGIRVLPVAEALRESF